MNQDDTVTRDEFGNKVTLTKLNDGRYKKTTQTNKNTKFEFLGDTYSYDMLEMSDTLKVYWDNYHSERKLVKDRYGRLFHYRYDEEMNFDGGPDREDILWMLVANERDSDQLSQVGNMSLLREPFVAADEADWVAAHEYVDSKFVEGLKKSKKFGLHSILNFTKTYFSKKNEINKN